MIIDVIDVTDPLLNHTKIALDRVGRSRILTYREMSNGLGQMVVDICGWLGRPTPQRFDPGTAIPRSAMEIASDALRASWKRIDALRIWGHGDIGGQNISAGRDGSGVVPHRTGLSEEVAWRDRVVLGRLTPCFAPGARVELRGCAVGRGYDGMAFLRSLAAIWKVKVYGPVELQPGTGLDWVGPVYEVQQSGARLVSGPKI